MCILAEKGVGKRVDGRSGGVGGVNGVGGGGGRRRCEVKPKEERWTSERWMELG